MSTRYKIGWRHILLGVILAVGLAARLNEVHYNFDGDEIASVKLASGQFAEVISRALRDRPHPPLHYALLHFWIKAFGASEVSARTLSVLFSGAFLVMSYVLLRRFVATRLALGLLSILALSPLFVYYGQQARPYALIAFLATANLVAFIRILDVPNDHKRLGIWATTCALLVYSQYLAIFIIAFEVALALFVLRSQRLTIFAYGMAATALILPWLIGAMGGAVADGTDPLRRISWIAPPSIKDFAYFYVSIFGEVPVLSIRWLLPILGFLGVAYFRHLVTSRNLPASHVLLFLIGFGLPAIVYVGSVVGPKPVFASRQMLGAAIAFIAAIGIWLTALPRTWAAGLLLTLLAWTAAALPKSFPHNSKPPWRSLARTIDDRHGPVTVVTQEGWVSAPLDYYRKLGAVRRWKEFTRLQKSDDFLFVCRPSKCSNIEIEALKSHKSLWETWRWGERNELRVYEIKGAPKLAPST